MPDVPEVPVQNGSIELDDQTVQNGFCTSSSEESENNVQLETELQVSKKKDETSLSSSESESDELNIEKKKKSSKNESLDEELNKMKTEQIEKKTRCIDKRQSVAFRLGHRTRGLTYFPGTNNPRFDC